MFRCRLALALGVPPSTVEEFGASDIDLLSRYWNEEPWGAYRDNIHAALIARTIHNTNFKKKVTLDDFMLRRPDRVETLSETTRRDDVFGMFKMMAGGVKRKAKGKTK